LLQHVATFFLGGFGGFVPWFHFVNIEVVFFLRLEAGPAAAWANAGCTERINTMTRCTGQTSAKQNKWNEQWSFFFSEVSKVLISTWRQLNRSK
jgi:hypothetical protein